MKIEKNISLQMVEGDITDVTDLQNRKIDAIVNAANCMLRGSRQGVDGAIHSAIQNFRTEVYKELDTDGEIKRIRCSRGKAVTTTGYGLCKYVIHTVSPQYDGSDHMMNIGSSSAIRMLESCYYEVMKQVRKHPDIRNIAVPIIGSGHCGFPFPMAFEIAVTSLNNALIDWKEQEPESYEIAELEYIYVYIYHGDKREQEKRVAVANQIYQRYKAIFDKQKKAVFQSSWTAHMRYWQEIRDYDQKRGYFFCAKMIRELLMLIRMCFMPWMLLKDLFGGRDWERRRQFVEIFAIIKMIIPVLFLRLDVLETHNVLGAGLLIYNMADTLTYLLSLIIMSDIQRPSANIIRSMIMLFINYMEVSLEMAALFKGYHQKGLRSIEAVAFGILGNMPQTDKLSGMDYAFLFVESGIRFFFISLVFGYFASHMRRRRFRS